MVMISEALQSAVNAHQAGNLAQAEILYRQVLQADPNQPDAWHLLGVIAQQFGQSAAAVECISRAIQLNPAVAACHNNLGEAYRGLGRLDEALACYRRALQLDPTSRDANYNLAINLANSQLSEEKLDEAADWYRKALHAMPEFAATHYNLGNVLRRQGQFDEALACYRRALQLKPDLVEAHNNLGSLLQDLGQLDEAGACFERALEIQPDFAEAHSNLGSLYLEQGQAAKSEAACRRALEVDPNHAGALSNLGGALQSLCHFEEAEASCRRALQLRPDMAEAYRNLSGALWGLARIDEAIVCCRRVMDLQPANVAAHSSMLAMLQYRPGVSLAELVSEKSEFERLRAEPLQKSWQRHNNIRDPKRRLRLGFVSPDLNCHPVGCFLGAVLKNLDPTQTETVCYSDLKSPDYRTTELRGAATEWRDIHGWSHERLTEQIRSDQIDILFDLAGHTPGNRLLVFARKPAPMQITWIGYEGTTGLAAMDYIVADRHEIPTEAERHFREQVLYMPDCYVCYDPPSNAPSVSSLPALEQGYATLGCFNNPAKINSGVIDVWARIMRRLPSARLVFKSKGMNDPASIRRLNEGFAAQEIDLNRLAFVGHSPYGRHLTDYAQIDLALDPFPFNGGATTCEALWMGVPVVTCPGETFASRHGLSFLSAIGLTETIARDLDDYIELALALAIDLPRLAALRAGLRTQMAASPLCDGPRFARNFTAIMREKWQQWVRSSE